MFEIFLNGGVLIMNVSMYTVCIIKRILNEEQHHKVSEKPYICHFCITWVNASAHYTYMFFMQHRATIASELFKIHLSYVL